LAQLGVLHAHSVGVDGLRTASNVPE
jgi:hypothetical protein